MRYIYLDSKTRNAHDVERGEAVKLIADTFDDAESIVINAIGQSKEKMAERMLDTAKPGTIFDLRFNNEGLILLEK